MKLKPRLLPGLFTYLGQVMKTGRPALNYRDKAPINRLMAKKLQHQGNPFNQALSPVFWNVTSKKLASTLSKKYRINLGKTSAELAVESFEAWSARETAGGPVQINLFRAEGIRSPVFFLMKETTGSVVCNLLLGGNLNQGPAIAGELAPISRQLASRFVKVLAAGVEAELSSFGLGMLKFCSTDSDIRMFNQISPGINCQTIKLQFEADQEVIEVAILLPYAAASRLAPVAPEEQSDPAVTLLSYKHLKDMEVDVSLALSELQMTLKELVQLVPGDVFNAGEVSQSGLLRVEGKPYKSGRLGIDDQNRWTFMVDGGDVNVGKE